VSIPNRDIAVIPLIPPYTVEQAVSVLILRKAELEHRYQEQRRDYEDDRANETLIEIHTYEQALEIVRQIRA